jgi:hypothetical protein
MRIGQNNLLPLFACSASPVVKASITTFEVCDYSKLQTSHVARVLENCVNLKELYIEDCLNVSAPDLLALVRETPAICSLTALSLEQQINSTFNKQKSLEWGRALTEFKEIFSARSDEFQLVSKVCACGGFLSDSP